ncbi:hypothetical protein AAGG74_07865 [Bacillus mexicanus]
MAEIALILGIILTALTAFEKILIIIERLKIKKPKINRRRRPRKRR